MALLLNITFGAACTGGNHFLVTANPTPGADRVFEFSLPEMDAPLTDEEQAVFVRVLIKQYRRQLNGASRAQQKAAIEAKVLDLTVVAI